MISEYDIIIDSNNKFYFLINLFKIVIALYSKGFNTLYILTYLIIKHKSSSKYILLTSYRYCLTDRGKNLAGCDYVYILGEFSNNEIFKVCWHFSSLFP